LQHANARILREMNRSGNAEEYHSLLARIRAALPDVTLRTTLIAGFPGESRSDAAVLESFITEAAFDYVGVFAYSQEDGTRAGERSDQIPMRTRRARQQRLRDITDTGGFARAAVYVGKELDVLVCGIDEEGVYGRAQSQAPDVDGIVHIENPAGFGDSLGHSAETPAHSTEAIAHGAETPAHSTETSAQSAETLIHGIVRVRITDAVCYDLYGSVVNV
ncbi:MAG: hypothetical protein FWD43_02095, partial [Coriobacteriia bacterium]|nr:hypothetical protein [Coriobacteriia bacterium]